MFAGVTLLALAFAQSAQKLEPNPRAEVAWRLRQLEEDWLHVLHADPAKAVARVETATQRFFQGDLAACAEALDLARYDLWRGDKLSPSYEALALVPRCRLLDASTNELEAELSWLYGKGMTTFITVNADLGDKTLPQPIERGLTPKRSAPLGMTIDLTGAGEGDQLLDVLWWDTDYSFGDRKLMISIVRDRDARIAALEKAVAALTDEAPRLERETTRMQLELLRALAGGSNEVHDYPAARVLSQAEQVVVAAAKGERWYGPERAGEFWLALPVGDATVRTRVLVPNGLSRDKPAPLVVAFHGASFDEDTWFDGYGGGAITGLCSWGGWMLAAPHCTAEDSPAHVEATIDALATIYPIDRARVFLVGHSRGAGTALHAYAASPERYRGIAAIGSASASDELDALVRRPLFLAAGDHDFARDAVVDLNSALIAKGAKRVKLTIYPNVEHWLAVQAALPDVFAWFDTLLAK